jgi:hypothetical protein
MVGITDDALGEHSLNIQRTFREHSGSIQGTFRAHSMNIQCYMVGIPGGALWLSSAAEEWIVSTLRGEKEGGGAFVASSVGAYVVETVEAPKPKERWETYHLDHNFNNNLSTT